MKREDFTIDGIPEGYTVYDVDLTPSGRPIAAVSPSEDSSLPAYIVTGSNSRFGVPDASRRRWQGFVAEPIARCGGEGVVVLVMPRWRDDSEPGGWVLDHSGRILATFNSGDGVQDILASDRWIVATYFDEGVFSEIEPGDEGLAFFDIGGSYLFGYRTRFGEEGVDVSDCYAAVWSGAGEIMFCAYTNFELVRIDLSTGQQRIIPTPKELHGATAISSRDDTVYFHAPYQWGNRIFAWQIGGGEVVHAGASSGRRPSLRGLPGGRFISPKPDGYTILSFD